MTRGESPYDTTRHEEPFAALLRRLREAAGLTQEELASGAGLSAKAISMLERGERRRPYPHTVRSLADALALPEPERAALFAAVPGRKETSPADDTLRLPASPTALVGREEELTEVRALLLDPGARLVTLTGTGGVGKTRLSLEAARQVAEQFPDGAVFVGLAPLRESALVLPAVARALGVREAETGGLREHLRGRRLLLVLDNFEHVPEAAPGVAGLLETCPGLTVLATSRAPLRIRGEREYPIPPLGLPASTTDPAAWEVMRSPSGRLFVERARAASPTFDLTETNVAAVAAICWRLAGLPLALELAAAKARYLDPASLLSRLDWALATGWPRDAPDRQRTMRATMDWSYDLLREPEKALLRRLSVFAGGFSLGAAEAVGGSSPEDIGGVLDRLGGLVDQSLVVPEPGRGGGTGYGLLEPVREYALRRLEESEEHYDVRRRHATWFLAFAEKASAELGGSRQVEWLGLLETEQNNLRAAVGWLLDRGPMDDLARFAWALWLFWWIRGYYGEGRYCADGLLASPGQLPEAARGKALFVAGLMRIGQGEYDRGVALCGESVEVLRRVGDEAALAIVLAVVGVGARGQGDYHRSRALLEESLASYRAQGDRAGTALALANLGRLEALQGDRRRARSMLEESVSLARELGDKSALGSMLHNAALVPLQEGEYGRAEALLREGLALSDEVGYRDSIAYCLEGLAWVAAATRKPLRAARLWGAAQGVREASGASLESAERPLFEEQLAAARARLPDDADWTVAREEGRAMGPEGAVAEALGEG